VAIGLVVSLAISLLALLAVGPLKNCRYRADRGLIVFGFLFGALVVAWFHTLLSKGPGVDAGVGQYASGCTRRARGGTDRKHRKMLSKNPSEIDRLSGMNRNAMLAH
jgi:hypothetical protein